MTKLLNIVILDHQGNIIAVNNAWQRFAADNSDDQNIIEKTGIGANYLEVCRLAEGNCSAEAQVVYQGITDVLEGKVNSFSLEYPCHSPSQERWFSLHCTPLLSSEMRAVISHSDITDKKDLNKILIHSEENYHRLFSDNPFPMFVFDIEKLRFLEVNQAAVEHYGYTREEFLEMTIKDIRSDEDIPKMLRKLSTLDEHSINVGIWDHLKKDGTIIKAEVNTHLLNFEGRLARLVIINDVTERLQTEEKLKLNEQRYRLMFEDNPFPMIIYDYKTLKVLDVNQATCLHYGYTRDEFLKMSSTNFGSPSDIENIKGLVEKNGRGRTVYGVWKHKKKDGTEIFVETTSHKLDIEGENSRIVLINDVTEKIKAEEELREAEERFRSTFEQAAVGISHVAPDGRLLQVNQKICEITGYTKEELTARKFQDITFPDDLEKDLNLIKKVLAGEIETYSIEKRYIRKDTSIIWINLTVSLVRDSEGQPKYFISVIEDINHRKNIENEMQQWADAFENCSHGIGLGDPKTNRIIAVNDAYAKMLGRTKNEIVNESVLLGFDPEIHKIAKEAVQTADKDGSVQFEAIRKRSDGTSFVSLLDIVSVRGESGEVLYRVATMQDISSRKEAEEKLRRSEEKLRQSQKMEAVGRLAGGIAHDFNNMLTVIKGYSDLILRSIPKENPLHNYVVEIKEAGERSTYLTSQLLAFSRTQVLHPEILNINQVISKTVKMLKLMIGEDIQIDLELASEIGNIKGDPGQLAQVLINLLVNARDAMPEGGTIKIKTAQVFLNKNNCPPELGKNGGKFIRMEVEDSGIGMSKEILSKAFEPFFTTKEKGKGTGLGLSTVYGIVKQSGGYITARSKLKKGTTFEIYFPLVSLEISVNENNGSLIPLPAGKEKILIVEDEEIVRRLTRAALEESGYQVVEARNGAEAIDILKKENVKIDLIITDIVMPEMSGFELYQNLSQMFAQPPKFLFTSGYLEDERIKNVNIDISQNFIAKPFWVNELILKIQEVLGLDKAN